MRRVHCHTRSTGPILLDRPNIISQGLDGCNTQKDGNLWPHVLKDMRIMEASSKASKGGSMPCAERNWVPSPDILPGLPSNQSRIHAILQGTSIRPSVTCKCLSTLIGAHGLSIYSGLPNINARHSSITY